MNTINDRIAYLIKDLGITKTKFAETINLSQPFVSAVCSGSKMPSDRTISDICREFNVSLAWLEDGEGEMYVQRSENERMALMFTDVLAEADESTRKRGIAAALDGESDDVFRIEIGGVRGERSPRGVLDALIHGQDRDIARAAQPSVGENPLQTAQRTDAAVGFGPDAVHGVGSRQVQRLFVDGAAYVGEVVAGLLP